MNDNTPENQPELPSLQELLRRTDDPGQLLPVAWLEAATGRLSGEIPIQLASAPALAGAATPASVERLVRVLGRLMESYGADAFSFAGLLYWHACALNERNAAALSLPLFDALRPLFELHAAGEMLGRLHMSRAGALARLGSEDALAEYDLARTILEAAGAPAYVGQCLLNHGAALAQLGRGPEALERWEAALPLLRAHAAPPLIAACLQNLASRYGEAGRHADAVRALDEALPLLKGFATPDRYARCLVDKGEYCVSSRNVAEGIAAFDEALPLLKEHAAPDLHAQLVLKRATVLGTQGRYAEALAGLEEAVPLTAAHSPPKVHATCLASRALALRDVGRCAESVAQFFSAYPLIREHVDPAFRTACWAAWGNALTVMGAGAEALAAYDRFPEDAWACVDADDRARCSRNRANTLNAMGWDAEALAQYDEAIPLIRGHATPGEYADCLTNRAAVLARTGRHEEAITGFREALQVLRWHGLPGAIATVLRMLANTLQLQDRNAEAATTYEEALPLLDAHAAPGALAVCLADYGAALKGSDRFADASAAFGRAIPLLAEHGPAEQHARALMLRAFCFEALGDHDREVAAYEEGLPMIRAHFPIDVQIGCLMSWARGLFYLGRYGDTVAAYDSFLPLVEGHAPSYTYGECVMNRATALHMTGRDAEAVAGYDRALPLLAPPNPHPDLYAVCVISRADLLRRQGRAVELDYERLLPILKDHGPRKHYAIALMNCAMDLVRDGRGADALAAFDEALPLLKEHAPDIYPEGVLERAVAVPGATGHEDRVAAYDTALPLLRDRMPVLYYAQHLLGRASALLHLGRRDEACADLDTAARLMRDHPNVGRYADFVAGRAAILAEMGDSAGAGAGFAEARRAMRAARRRAITDDTVLEVYGQRALIHELAVRTGLAGNRPDDAYDAVREGKAGVVDDLRYHLSTVRGAEPASVGAARSDLTAWLRTEPPHPHDAGASAEAAERFLRGGEERARRYLLEWGQFAHAYDPARDRPPSADAPPTRADVQAALPERWALIDFWRGQGDRLHAFVLVRGADLQVVTLPTPPLTGVPGLLDALHTVSGGEPNLRGLDDLGVTLFKPLLPLLRQNGITGLYLVPHGILHAFPLHAARWYESGSLRYLCDEFDVAYLPSANLLPGLPQPDPGGDAFVLANPEAGTARALHFSHWEGSELRARLNVADDRFFLGADGGFAATDRWAGCGYVHFSCHGEGNERFAPLSHLRLADDLLLAHDVLHRKPPLKPGAVVVLNGCETSVPDWRAVNEGMGLMTAFLLRGAGVVFCTQWKVFDLCAAPLALHFAERLRAGKSPVEAMRSARGVLRNMSRADVLQTVSAARAVAEQGSGSRGPGPALPNWMMAQQKPFDNPVFWAAFQLVGRAA